MKIMVDTNIYDKIIETPGMLERLNSHTADGHLTVLTTFVQEEQIAAITDTEKRKMIQSIQRTKVPPAAGLWGLTPWGEFPWGSDGSEGGLPVHEVMTTITPEQADVAMPKEHAEAFGLRRGHSGDALIASTASVEADVLVTEDGRLRKKVKNSGAKCHVWTFDNLREYVFK